MGSNQIRDQETLGSTTNRFRPIRFASCIRSLDLAKSSFVQTQSITSNVTMSVSTFGQQLVHTEKKHRDRAFRKLRQFLQLQSATWSALDVEKLWKALFYSMWMSDKMVIQHELALNLADLVDIFPSPEMKLLYVDTFFLTMAREWPGIDSLRLDKFYTLIRKMFFKVFQLEEQKVTVEQWTSIFTTRIFTPEPRTSTGLMLHVLDIYVVELNKALVSDTSTIQLWLQPMYSLLASESDRIVVHRAAEQVFRLLLPTAEDTENDDDDAKLDLPEEEQSLTTKTSLFPQFDRQAVHDALFQLASSEGLIVERNRKILYQLVHEFHHHCENKTTTKSSESSNVKAHHHHSVAQKVEEKQKPKEVSSTTDETTKSKSKSSTKPQNKRKQLDTDEKRSSTETLKKSKNSKVDHQLMEVVVTPSPAAASPEVDDRKTSHSDQEKTKKKKKKEKASKERDVMESEPQDEPALLPPVLQEGQDQKKVLTTEAPEQLAKKVTFGKNQTRDVMSIKKLQETLKKKRKLSDDTTTSVTHPVLKKTDDAILVRTTSSSSSSGQRKKKSSSSLSLQRQRNKGSTKTRVGRK